MLIHIFVFQLAPFAYILLFLGKFAFWFFLPYGFRYMGKYKLPILPTVYISFQAQ